MKVKNDWIYIMNSKRATMDMLPDIHFASVCLVTRTFQPEKYGAMLKIYLEKYVKTGDPTKVLEGFLSIHATGKFETFDSKDYEAAVPTTPAGYLSSIAAAAATTAATSSGSSSSAAGTTGSICSMKELVDMLGSDVVILWNGMMLKKRILVTGEHSQLSDLQRIVRTLPAFVVHRLDWSILRPLITTDAEHTQDISTCGFYVAGSVDSGVAARGDSYDILLSLQDKLVSVAPHATDGLRMASIHRDVANMLVELCGGSSDSGGGSLSTVSNKDLVKAIGVKNAQIVENLKACGEDGRISEASINARVSNPSTQQWLLRLAIAEGLV